MGKPNRATIPIVDAGNGASLIASTQDTLRNIDRDLRNECQDIQQAIPVSDIGLAGALQQQMTQLNDSSSLQVELQLAPDGEMARLPREVQDGLYHVCQELVRNARDHSHAERVQVSLGISSTQAFLEVRDYGMGFVAPGSLTQSVANNHFRLARLQQRVMTLGGNVNIESAIEQGTCVHVALPIEFSSRMSIVR